MSRIVCISNRVSLPDPKTGEIKAGGLAVGVKAALKEHGGGLWFGWNGAVKKESGDTRSPAFQQLDDIEFLTLPLTQAEYDGYYRGMANEQLWPLMHELGEHIEGRPSDYATYKNVNRLFAQQIRPHLRPDDLIWVHDYHLIPLGRELRELGVRNRLGFFNHIPMPSPTFLGQADISDALRQTWQELTDNLFAYDQVGFQSYRDFDNFAASIGYDGTEPVRYDTVSIRNRGRETAFGVFPISIETGELFRMAQKSSYKVLEEEKERYKILIGAERLDYTKGLDHRLNGYFQYLTQHPEAHAQVRYHQITPLSRSDIRQYKQTIAHTREMVKDIRTHFATDDWDPIAYSEKGLPREKLIGAFRYAHAGLVTPLVDGQNLVAKEFIAAQDPEDPGVLILSRTAGAAEQLEGLGVLCVDPQNAFEIATSIDRAIHMPLAERRTGHQKALAHLRQYDIHHWAESFLQGLAERRTSGAGYLQSWMPRPLNRW